MIRTVITVPKGELLPDAVISAYFFLSQANAYRKSRGLPPVFDLEIAGVAKENWIYDGYFGIRAAPLKKLTKDIDLIIIPGFLCDMALPLEENAGLIAWLKDQYEKHGTELASMCTGAFLLAATGLLKGKKCTTHWAFTDAFTRYFPEVSLEPEQIVTDDSGIYTSGGAYSSLNLLLYLVEKFAGREAAIWLSKVFQVDLNRSSQKSFVIFSNQKKHPDDLIRSVQEFMETHYMNDLNLSVLARTFALSKRTLLRRFKSAAGITPLDYLQRVRVEAAKRSIEGSDKPINQIILECGYLDGATFRAVFKRHTGVSPTVYRKKYGINK